MPRHSARKESAERALLGLFAATVASDGLTDEAMQHLILHHDLKAERKSKARAGRYLDAESDSSISDDSSNQESTSDSSSEEPSSGSSSQESSSGDSASSNVIREFFTSEHSSDSATLNLLNDSSPSRGRGRVHALPTSDESSCQAALTPGSTVPVRAKRVASNDTNSANERPRKKGGKPSLASKTPKELAVMKTDEQNICRDFESVKSTPKKKLDIKIQRKT